MLFSILALYSLRNQTIVCLVSVCKWASGEFNEFYVYDHNASLYLN